MSRVWREFSGLKLFSSLACAVALAGGLSVDAEPAKAADAALPEVPEEWAEVRANLERYRDPIKAIHDGYLSTLGCVNYPEGGMGIHFLNGKLISPEPDPMHPQILLYEPDEEGKLHLVGAEWFMPLTVAGETRPEILGQPFDGPMEGHYPVMPKELHHYDLHVWLFKENPDGLFKWANPEVGCGSWTYVEDLEPHLIEHAH